jgi:hypothetical protein
VPLCVFLLVSNHDVERFIVINDDGNLEMAMANL